MHIINTMHRFTGQDNNIDRELKYLPGHSEKIVAGLAVTYIQFDRQNID